MNQKSSSFKEIFGNWQTYSKLNQNFWLTQIAMSAFGLFTNLATTAAKIPWLIIGSSVLSIGFFCFLLYDSYFMFGLGEAIRIKSGRITRDPLKGMKLALISYAPTILVTLIVAVFALINFSGGYVNAKLLLLLVFEGTYWGVWMLLSEKLPEVLLLLLMLLPGIIAPSLGYYLGMRETPIRKLLGIPVKPPKNAAVKSTKERPNMDDQKK